jgi:hypothetical protein
MLFEAPRITPTRRSSRDGRWPHRRASSMDSRRLLAPSQRAHQSSDSCRVALDRRPLPSKGVPVERGRVPVAGHPTGGRDRRVLEARAANRRNRPRGADPRGSLLGLRRRRSARTCSARSSGPAGPSMGRRASHRGNRSPRGSRRRDARAAGRKDHALRREAEHWPTSLTPTHAHRNAVQGLTAPPPDCSAISRATCMARARSASTKRRPRSTTNAPTNTRGITMANALARLPTVLPSNS